MRVTARPKMRMWKPQRPKAFEPVGIVPGATVTGQGRAQVWAGLTTVTGQVWSKAAAPRSWWVVSTQGWAWLVHEDTITVHAQIVEQAAFEWEVAA